MTLMARRRALIGAQQSAAPGGIPAEYQEVTWIRAGVSAYLDTGIVPKSNPRIVAEVKPNEANKVRGILGLSAGNTPYFSLVCSNTSGMCSSYYGNSGTANGVINEFAQTASFFEIDFSNILKIAGRTINTETAVSFADNTSTIRLFNTHDQTGNWAFKRTAIYDGGTLVADLVPCYRKADAVIGMYDTVRKAFLTGAGGTLYKGSDVI